MRDAKKSINVTRNIMKMIDKQQQYLLIINSYLIIFEF